jgi:hypothetical protein
LNSHDRASYAAIIRGKTEHKEAFERYYMNPHICKECGKVIIPLERRGGLAQARKKKFCNKQCAAKYNNSDKPKRKKATEKWGGCHRCGIEILYTQRTDKGYWKREYCSDCRLLVSAEKRNTVVIARLTKRGLLERRGDWTSANIAIRVGAQRAYAKSGKPYICHECGYSLHVEICHIRDVADFPETALISEINDPENLVALCPNHHWEFDSGLLELSEDVKEEA